LTIVHLDGYSVREAAQLLGWTVINVKVRAYRARRALRAILCDNVAGGSHDASR
jgi:RNA polymerase sigma-70 factor (ECF subfamily)